MTRSWFSPIRSDLVRNRLRPRALGLAVAGLTALTACGTAYDLPSTTGTYEAQASRIFAEARSTPPPKPISAAAAQARFDRVARRVRPAGRSACEQLRGPQVDCQVQIEIDRQMKEANAYFTYEKGRPVIRMSLPLLQVTRNDDEAAFVMAHEYGHLIGGHIEKKQQQVAAGALIAGTLAGLATAVSGDFDEDALARGLGVGAAVGGIAYSQTYELESDSLGTRIAHAAGYDAPKGARFFARPGKPQSPSGGLNFWSTHPPDEKRLALVLATQAEIDRGQGLRPAQ